MDLTAIEQQLHARTAKAFLTAVLKTKQSENTFIYFSEQLNSQFKQNAAYLASDYTVTPQMIASLEATQGLVVAQTIDGDYIAGDNHQTWIIPDSLYTKDIETYELFLLDFFKAYNAGSIQSAFLPKLAK